ncbi:MAG: response regulator [Nitrospirae bacterium]|nr:response regulator [Candidatus Manganitrophaceae bacterium]
MESEQKKMILVVDDDPSIRHYLADLLSSEGYAVCLASGGEEALAQIKQKVSPDAVILDIMMPRVDGFETLRKIREIDKTVPIIVLSAIGQTGTIVQAVKMGASDYLKKPFDDWELSFLLGRLFERTI